MTFASVLLASFIGGTAAQALVLWSIGRMAAKVEAKKVAAAKEAIMEYNAMLLKEQQRMKEYARMEG